MIKLSIIVPIYNVEQYLRKCVDSLLNQDLDNYEIILVDDGSTDGSGAICDYYVSIDDRCTIKVIHRENGGLSAARNSGIEVAQGEYVMFVDSDDYIEANVLGVLLAQVEREELDVLRYNYQNVRVVDAKHLDVARLDSSNLAYEVFQPYKQPHKVDKRDDVVDGVTYLKERMGYECYAWQFIIKRGLICSNQYSEFSIQNFADENVLFTPGIHFEDVDWLPRMMVKAKRVGSTETVVYNYFWREGSITLTQGNKEKIRKNLDDRMGIIEKYSELRKQHPACTWLRNMQSSMVAGVLTTVAREFYDERKEYIKRLCAWNVFPIAIANHGKTHARRARIINAIGPNAFCLLMHFVHCVKCKV